MCTQCFKLVETQKNKHFFTRKKGKFIYLLVYLTRTRQRMQCIRCQGVAKLQSLSLGNKMHTNTTLQYRHNNKQIK